MAKAKTAKTATKRAAKKTVSVKDMAPKKGQSVAGGVLKKKVYE